MPDVDGGSLWELVKRRAEATPDALAAKGCHNRLFRLPLFCH